MTRGVIAQWKNKAIYHIGPERDLGLFEGLDLQLAPPETATDDGADTGEDLAEGPEDGE